MLSGEGGCGVRYTEYTSGSGPMQYASGSGVPEGPVLAGAKSLSFAMETRSSVRRRSGLGDPGTTPHG